jgi:inward rectifier potassium channel
MADPPSSSNFDPGLTQRYTGPLQRTINSDGDFNVSRRGVTWHDSHPYLFLISTSWRSFIGIVVCMFIVTNVLFAFAYVLLGPDHIHGAETEDRRDRARDEFVNEFFFSTHTLTTVGYGNMYPVGPAANTLAALESLTGLMGFAVVTGLVFGRFSRPSARLGFSRNLLVTPYGDGMSLQFRIVNRRSNNLLDLRARVLLMTVQGKEGQLQRKFDNLALERDEVLFMPLTWTVVHPITTASPLHELTAEDLSRLKVEFLVLIKAFDDTFGQTVNTRFSYTSDEIVWGGKFTPVFEVDQNGELQLDINRISEYQELNSVSQLSG